MSIWSVAAPVGCGAIALLCWLISAARELTQKQNELNLADKQLAMYSLLHAKARDDPELQRTLEQMELSRTIYQDVAADYNHCIARPKNRLVARMLGYRPVEKCSI